MTKLTELERLGLKPMRGGDDAAAPGGDAAATMGLTGQPSEPTPAAAPATPTPPPADAATAAAGATEPQGEPSVQDKLLEQMNALAERLPQPPQQVNPIDQLAATGSIPPPPPAQQRQGDPRLAGQPQPQAAAQVPPQQQYADPQGGEIADPDMQAVEQYVAELAETAAQRRIAPILQQLQQQQIAADAEDLKAEYDEFRDPEKASQIVEESRRYAAQLGVPQLGNHPRFIELALLASRQLAAMPDETSGGQNGSGVQLETQGGAGLPPAPADVAQQERDAIVAASKPQSDADRLLGIGGNGVG